MPVACCPASPAKPVSGGVWGRPWRARGTRGGHRVSQSECIAGLSGGEDEGEGQQLPSAAQWTFVVSPPRDRLMAQSCGSSAGARLGGPGPTSR
jgi:hypothetical protein